MQQLLLLHGALGHPKEFKPYKKELEQYFEVHEILFAGHGQSSIPKRGITMDTLVEELHLFFEKYQLKQPHVFGYSMGGYVAMCYALQYPSRIQSILTLATKFNWTEETARLESKMLVPEVIEEKVPHFGVQLATLHGNEKWKSLVTAIAEMVTDLGINPRLIAENYARLSLPIQLMVGDSDKMVTIEETLAASKKIPNARLAVLPATKHPLQKVRSRLLLNFMKDFWEIGTYKTD